MNTWKSNFMARRLRMALVAVMVVGLLMLPTSMPAFAVGPKPQISDFVQDSLLDVPGHVPSCTAQDPYDKPSEAQDSGAAFDQLVELYEIYCPDF